MTHRQTHTQTGLRYYNIDDHIFLSMHDDRSHPLKKKLKFLKPDSGFPKLGSLSFLTLSHVAL